MIIGIELPNHQKIFHQYRNILPGEYEMPPHNVILISIIIAGIIFIAAPVLAVSNIVPQGGDVFIGENGLDLSSFISSGQVISWYSSSQIPKSIPAVTYTVTDPNRSDIDPGEFIPYAGNWYIGTTSQVALVVIEPSVSIRIWDQTSGKDVTNKSAPFGDFVNFAIENNIYPISGRPGFDPSKDGFMTIRVENSDGTVYNRLLQDPKVSLPLGNLTVDATPYNWVDVNNSGQGWNTGLYPIGSSYRVRAVSDANGMDVNYPLSGKTVSSVVSMVVGFPPDLTQTPRPTITPPTLQPTITPPTPQPTITPPTPQPTITTPTLQPTITPPTPQPTITLPTLQPTITPPTPEPTITPPTLQPTITPPTPQPTITPPTLQPTITPPTLYDIVSAFESGDTVILEVNWSAAFNVAIASLALGDTMRARFAVFLEFEGDRIRRQRNYDCFDPF